MALPDRLEQLRHWVPTALLALLVALFVAGWGARRSLDLQLSMAALEGLRVWVLELGWRGPAVFVGLVSFRSFLLLPSALLLVLGGLAFGAIVGTALGAAGLVLSAALQFGFARALGNEWVRPRLGEAGHLLEARLRRAGPWAVGLFTAHPAGPMTAVHVAAGVTGMSLLSFVIAVLLAGPVRAGAYAWVGAALLDWGLFPSILLGVALLALALLPLAHPRVRAWLLPG